MQQLQPYTPEIESMMQIFYQSLSEKERRRYAAIEALKIGYGGISYIERLLGANCRTIKRGIEELKLPESMNQSRIRAKGGGRKRKLDTMEGLESAFERVIDRHIAGSPMDEEIRWTHLTRQQIADLLWSEEEIKVSVTVIDQLLEQQNFRRRQAFKTKATGNNPLRNEQFEREGCWGFPSIPNRVVENIERLIDDYQKAGNPVMSVDTKKKKNSDNCIERDRPITNNR